MDNQTVGNSKSRIIAAIVIITAVALIYVVVNAKSDDSLANSSDTPISATPTKENSNEHPGGSHDGNAEYIDGAYTASSSYTTPGGSENITVSVMIQDNLITDTSVQQTPKDVEAELYQTEFRENYKPLVIGRKIGDINLSRVSGSSLTSRGFNDAIEKIKNQAHNHDS